MTTHTSPLSPGTILSGPHWPGRVRVVRVEPSGTRRLRIGAVLVDDPSQFIDKIILRTELSQMTIEPPDELRQLNGDPFGFKVVAEAVRIQLAYTYDPQFAVSLARIQPLPHQLEAVYHYMLPQPRLRFLLADDPGAGKTIMIGLLLKELKLRGVAARTLIVAPANLVAQWQREMAEKFDEPFDIVDRATLSSRGNRAWELHDQCITSLDFAWRPDVMESLAHSPRWQLVVFDEAHKLAAYRRGTKLSRTRRYRLGELLSEQTNHVPHGHRVICYNEYTAKTKAV